VGDARVLGGVGNGWAVTQTTLAHERASHDRSAAAGAAGRKGGWLARRAGDLRPGAEVQAAIAEAGAAAQSWPLLLELCRARSLNGDPLVRQELARLHIAAELIRFTALRARAAAKAGRPPG